MGIPERLRNQNYAFIKLCRPDCQSHEQPCQNPGKVPIGGQYNYELRSIEEIDTWLENGGNAGILAKGTLVFIDIDDPELVEGISPRLPPTFTVRTGKGVHYYFECPEWDKNLTFRDFNGEIASFRANDEYVVIPPSVHPSGSQYKIVEDRPIRSIGYSDFESIKTAIGSVVDDRIELERSAIETLLNEIPKNARTGDSALIPDNDNQSAVDKVMRLRSRTQTWQMWVTSWLQAVGLDTNGIVDSEITEMLIRNARGEEFDKEETIRQLQAAIESSS